MRISILSFFLLVNCSLFGQSLDLNGYLDLLKKENLQLKQSENKIDVSKENVKLAKAELLPGVNSDFSLKRDFTKSYMFLNESTEGLPSKFRTNFKNNIDANIIAEQVLYAPFASANYKLSKLASQESELIREDLTKELIHKGTLLFYQAVYAKESLLVLEKNKLIAKSQWDKMKSLFEEGFVSEIKVQKSELYYKRSLPALQSAQNTYSTVVNNMKYLARIPLSQELVLEGSIASPDLLISEQNDSDTNLNFNSQIKLLNKQVEMSEQQIKINKTLWQPTVKVGLGYSYSANDNKFKFDQNNKLFYGRLNIQLPIFNGGRNSAKLRVARLEHDNLQLERENSRLLLNNGIENSKLNIRYAIQKIEEENELIRLSEKELSVANEQISLGAITPLEFKEIRLELTKSRLGLLNANLDYRIASLQLQRILQK